MYFYKHVNILEERMIAQQCLIKHFCPKKSSCFTVFIVILAQIYIYNACLSIKIWITKAKIMILEHTMTEAQLVAMLKQQQQPWPDGESS